MSTKVKVEITGRHGKVRVTVENKKPDGSWSAYDPDSITLPGELGDNTERLVYGTQRLIVEELPFE